MLPIVKTVIAAGAYYLVGEVLRRGDGSRQRLRRWASGTALLLLAAGVGWLGLAFLLGSLFWQLADAATLVRPALLAGGVTLLVALLLLIQGWRLLSR